MTNKADKSVIYTSDADKANINLSALIKLRKPSDQNTQTPCSQKVDKIYEIKRRFSPGPCDLTEIGIVLLLIWPNTKIHKTSKL